MNQEAIGKFISSCRKKKNLTQNELASRIGVTDKAISKWENGRCLPDLSLIRPLCEALDITMNELLNGDYITGEQIKEKSEENLNHAFSYFKEETNKKNKRTLLIIVIILLTFSIIGIIFYNKEQIKKSHSLENSYILYDESLKNIKTRMDELSNTDEKGEWISIKNYTNKTKKEDNINSLINDINYCYNFLNNSKDINNLKIYMIKGQVTKNELNYFNKNQDNLTCLNIFDKYKNFYFSEDEEDQNLYNNVKYIYSIKETPLFRKDQVTFSELNSRLIIEASVVERLSTILYGEYRRNYET